MSETTDRKSVCKNCGSSYQGGLFCPQCGAIGGWYVVEVIAVAASLLALFIAFAVGMGVGYYLGFLKGVDTVGGSDAGPLQGQSTNQAFTDTSQLLAHWLSIVAAILLALLILNLYQISRRTKSTDTHELGRLQRNRIVLLYLIAIVLPILLAAALTGTNWLLALLLFLLNAIRWFASYWFWIAIALILAVCFRFRQHIAATVSRMRHRLFTQNKTMPARPVPADAALILKQEFVDIGNPNGGPVSEVFERGRISQIVKHYVLSKGLRRIIEGPAKFGGTSAVKLALDSMDQPDDNLCLFQMQLAENEHPDLLDLTYTVSFNEVRGGKLQCTMPEVMGKLVIPGTSDEALSAVFEGCHIPKRLLHCFPRLQREVKSGKFDLARLVDGLNRMSENSHRPRFWHRFTLNRASETRLCIIIDRIRDLQVLVKFEREGLFRNKHFAVVVLARTSDIRQTREYDRVRRVIRGFGFRFEDVSGLVISNVESISQMLDILVDPAKEPDAEVEACRSDLCSYLQFAGKGVTANALSEFREMPCWDPYTTGTRYVKLRATQMHASIQRSVLLMRILENHWSTIRPRPMDPIPNSSNTYDLMHFLFPLDQTQNDYGQRIDKDDIRRQVTLASPLYNDSQLSLWAAWNLLEVLKHYRLLEDIGREVRVTWSSTPDVHVRDPVPSMAEPPPSWLDASGLERHAPAETPATTAVQETIPPSPDRPTSMWQEIKERFRELVQNTLDRAQLILAAVINMVYLYVSLVLTTVFNQYAEPYYLSHGTFDKSIYEMLVRILGIGTAVTVAIFVIQDWRNAVSRAWSAPYQERTDRSDPEEQRRLPTELGLYEALRIYLKRLLILLIVAVVLGVLIDRVLFMLSVLLTTAS